MKVLDEVTALAGAAGALEARWRDLSDDELLECGAEWERLGRLVDARRIGFAAEVEDRSTAAGAGLRLPARFGLRDGTDLVSRTTRVSRREAAGRVNLGSDLRPRSTLTGEALPGRFPALAEAVESGEVGLDSARIIVAMFRAVGKRGRADMKAVAERVLVEDARGFDAEHVRQLASDTIDRLDPDGTGDREHAAQRNRALTLGRVDEHGGSRFTGYAPAVERATIAAALAEERARIAMTRHRAAAEENDGPGPEWRETGGDERTVRQIDFDTFFALFTAGIRASAAGTASSGAVKAIPEVIITTTLADLEARAGSGVVAGTGARISIETVERLSCGGDVRLLVNGSAGEPLWLGRPARLFSPAQRKALVARSGGCQWPGCTAPPVWCDVHHIAWYGRDAGRTDIENGVLLCSFHHHLIHDPATRWRIQVHEGRPHLVPRTWTGPPEAAHRMDRRHDPVRDGPPVDDPCGRPQRMRHLPA